MSHIKIISATIYNEDIFWKKSYLGRSLNNFPDNLMPEVNIFYNNKGKSVKGLSEIYNNSINEANHDDILIFIHDDVYIHDWFLSERVIDGLKNYDIIGVAGGYNKKFLQPSWALEFDSEINRVGWQKDTNFSGCVNHFDYCNPQPSYYGLSPNECTLLDGVFLCLKSKTAISNKLLFDESFKFHCYDIDFCRNALRKGLRLGTWPISLTHNSGGAFDSKEFKDSAKLYIKKWNL